MRLKIGIAAGGSILGSAGGVDVALRQMVEALTDQDRKNQYYVLLNERADLVQEPAINAWLDRKWTPRTHFVVVRNKALPLTPFQQFQRRLRRKLGFAQAPIPTKGELYRAFQIDSLRLDLIHYPRTAISPLEVQTTCILGFWDLQHEYFPEFFTPEQRTGRTTHFRAAVAKARHIITPSNFTKYTLMEKYDVPAAKISVVPHGISETFRRATAAEVDRVRAKFDLPEKFIYYPANTWLHKNHRRLFQSLRLYRERFGQAPMVVLSGRLRGEHPHGLALAEEEGVDDCVMDLGYIPRSDTNAIFSAATLLVFPSLFEGFGIPLIEAMACECPIAAANSTAIPECVQDSALLFDPTDVNEIAMAIHQLLTDEPLRTSLTARGLDRVKRYQWRQVVPEILTVYQEGAKKSITGVKS